MASLIENNVSNVDIIDMKTKFSQTEENENVDLTVPPPKLLENDTLKEASDIPETNVENQEKTLVIQESSNSPENPPKHDTPTLSKKALLTKLLNDIKESLNNLKVTTQNSPTVETLRAKVNETTRLTEDIIEGDLTSLPPSKTDTDFHEVSTAVSADSIKITESSPVEISPSSQNNKLEDIAKRDADIASLTQQFNNIQSTVTKLDNANVGDVNERLQVLDNLQKNVDNISGGVTILNHKVAALASHSDKIAATCNNLEVQFSRSVKKNETLNVCQQMIRSHITALEQNSRYFELIAIGIPEDMRENRYDTCLKIATMMGIPFSSKDIADVYRISNKAGAYRHLIIRFVCIKTKNIWIRSVKRNSGRLICKRCDNDWPECEFYIYERTTTEERMIFRETKKACSRNGLPKPWMRRGVTYLKKHFKGPIIRINSLQDIDVKIYGLDVPSY